VIFQAPRGAITSLSSSLWRHYFGAKLLWIVNDFEMPKQHISMMFESQPNTGTELEEALKPKKNGDIDLIRD
jgi:hypothetical protein